MLHISAYDKGIPVIQLYGLLIQTFVLIEIFLPYMNLNTVI